MLAIDVTDSDLMLVMPHRHGGVAGMLIALEEAGLGVTRIEPRSGEVGMYRLTVQGRAEAAVTILEAIGCTVTPSPYPPT
jgi:DNA-binding PadR family transcriptional regulator